MPNIDKQELREIRKKDRFALESYPQSSISRHIRNSFPCSLVMCKRHMPMPQPSNVFLDLCPRFRYERDCGSSRSGMLSFTNTNDKNWTN